MSPPALPREVSEEPPGTAPAHWKFGTTADVGIGARAGSPSELFAQLGEGFTALLTDLGAVEPRQVRTVEVEARSLEGLAVAYLTELIGLFDEEAWLARAFEVELRGSPPAGLRAKLLGEPLDPTRHPVHVQVKAVTLHRLLIDLPSGRAQVIVDI